MSRYMTGRQVGVVMTGAGLPAGCVGNKLRRVGRASERASKWESKPEAYL